jgi:hypothetical protein
LLRAQQHMQTPEGLQSDCGSRGCLSCREWWSQQCPSSGCLSPAGMLHVHPAGSSVVQAPVTYGLWHCLEPSAKTLHQESTAAMPHPTSSMNWPGGQGSVTISLHAWKQICIAEAVCCVLVAAWLLSNGCLPVCCERSV